MHILKLNKILDLNLNFKISSRGLGLVENNEKNLIKHCFFPTNKRYIYIYILIMTKNMKKMLIEL